MYNKIFFVLLMLAAAAMAQSPLATISGTITDQQQARVANVEVVARQVETNLTYRAVSSTVGTYFITNLPLGRYEVTAQRAGFKNLRRTDINLEVGQQLRLDLVLEVGAVSESVTVRGEVTRVQTESSSLGTVVERQRFEKLPIRDRDPYSLVLLVAGAQSISKEGDSENVRYNGGPTKGNQVLLDGSLNVAISKTPIGTTPMVDTVEEFRVETNSLKAEFGVTGGGVVNLVTKAGTNAFHGSLHEFVRNDYFDARNAFVTEPDDSGRTKPIVRRNQYGGTLGGPLWLPKIYDGHNRTFFFFGYEQRGIRESGLMRYTVPTPLERGGNFTQTFDATGAMIRLFDPATTRANPSGSGFVRDTLPGNVVPKARMDPLSLRFLEFIPLPNTTPQVALTNSNNYLFMGSSPTDESSLSWRTDQRFTDKDSVFLRYTNTKSLYNNRGDGLDFADRAARHDQNDTHNGVLTYMRALTPKIMNEFKASAVRKILFFKAPGVDDGWPDKLGLPEILPRDIFPRVNISGIITLGNAYAIGYRAEHSIGINDSFSIVKGRHLIKTGADQRWLRLNWLRGGQTSGGFSFAPSLTNDPQRPGGSGIAMATFLLGEVSSGTQEFVPGFGFQTWWHSSYVQDDFKLTPRLTLNLGLRYDLFSDPVERHNRFTSFDPLVINPETKRLGVVRYAGVTMDRHFADRDNNNFGPRFGFAWDPFGKGKFVARGGYGLVYAMSDLMDIQINPQGFSATSTFAPIGGGPYKAFQFSEGPTFLNEALGAKAGPTALIGRDAPYQDRNAPSSYVQQWNFTLQTALPGNFTVAATYAGNHGVKLIGGDYDLNQIDPVYWPLGLQLQNLVTNPFFGQIPTGSLSGQTMSRGQLLKPYPDYLTVYTYGNHDSSSTYHSLQLTLERRYSHGLSTLVSFTGSKLIDDSYSVFSAGQRQSDYRLGRFNRRLDRGLDQYDIPKRFVGTVVYELPWGPGKRFLSGLSGPAKYLAGGWQVNAIYTIQPEGWPLAVRGANNYTVSWPDLVSNPSLPRSERSAARWFDTNAFRNPPDYVLGNAPRRLNTRGPGYRAMDLSLQKNIQLREGMQLQIRADAYNAFNNVNLNDPNVTFSPNRQGVNTNAMFGRITSAATARNIHLGMRLTF